MLSNVWSRTTQYPSTRLAGPSFNLAPKSCVSLLGDKSAFGSVSLAFLRSSLRGEAKKFPPLRFAMV